jgi:hypothetical protein
MLLADASAAVVTPRVPAMTESVSPALTVYVPGADEALDDAPVPPLLAAEAAPDELLPLLVDGVEADDALPPADGVDDDDATAVLVLAATDEVGHGVDEPGGSVAMPETAEPVAVDAAPAAVDAEVPVAVAVEVPVAVALAPTHGLPVPLADPIGVKVAGVVGKTAEVGNGSGGALPPEQAARRTISPTNGMTTIRLS